MILSKKDKLAIDRLVADAVDFSDARLILADLIDGVDSGLAMRLRVTQALPRLWEAVRFGTRLGREQAARCRALVSEYARLVHNRRRHAVHGAGPETEPGKRDGRRLTDRECEGSSEYRKNVEWRRRVMISPVYSYSHCHRLVMRGVEGYDVPPDVQRDLMALVERIRETLRDLGTVVLATKGG